MLIAALLLVLIGENRQYWVALGAIQILFCIYEIERSRMNSFFDTKRFLEEQMQAAKTEAEFLREERALELKNEMRKTMVRYLSHEIRSPLNVVMAGLEESVDGIIELLTTKNEYSHPLSNLLTILDDSRYATKTAIYTLNDLLDFESIEANKFTVDRSLIDTNKFLMMIRRCSMFAKKKGVNFDLKGSNHFKKFYVFVDELKMEQVFRNLIVNAVKFTPVNGSIVVSMEFRNDSIITEYVQSQQASPVEDSETNATEAGQTCNWYCVIDITDSGVGIASENQV